MDKLIVEFPGIDLNRTSQTIILEEGTTLDQFRKEAALRPLEGDHLRLMKESE